MSTDKTSVNKDTVKKIGCSARLHVPEDKQEKIAGELNAILNWIEELNEVNTDGVEPLASVTGHSLPQPWMWSQMVTRLMIFWPMRQNRRAAFSVVPKVVE